MFCCVGSLWLVCEGLHWILTRLLKPVHDSQKSEDPFSSRHVQKLMVIALFARCECKETSENTDRARPAAELGWRTLHPDPMQSVGCSGLRSSEALCCPWLDISAPCFSQLTLHIVSFTTLIITCACL